MAAAFSVDPNNNDVVDPCLPFTLTKVVRSSIVTPNKIAKKWQQKLKTCCVIANTCHVSARFLSAQLIKIATAALQELASHVVSKVTNSEDCCGDFQ